MVCDFSKFKRKIRLWFGVIQTYNEVIGLRNATESIYLKYLFKINDLNIGSQRKGVKLKHLLYF